MVTLATGVDADRAAAASPQDEQLFVQMINDLRATKGLPALVVNIELTSEARSWTEHMAASDQLAHSPDISGGISAQWSVLGENVGMHGIHDLGQLFQAFVNSPAHYQNLVDGRFNYVGVGVVSTSEGKLWTTHRFMAAPAVTPPPTPEDPPTTEAKPPPTAAPTTAPPATTQPPATNPPATTPPTAPTTVPTPSTPPTSGPTTTAAPSPEPPPATVAESSDTQPEGGVDLTIVDDPTAGPSMPDVPTVEQVLVELAEAGI